MYDGVIVGVGEEGLDVSSECGEGVGVGVSVCAT